MTEPSELWKARLARLPPIPSFTEDPIQDDTTDTSTETDSSTASIQTVVVSRTSYVFSSFKLTKSRPSEPLPWTNYFVENIRVASSADPSQTFNVYYTPPTAATAPVYVFHHGAGSSSLSFSLVAAQLRSSISCGVISFDVRYHGSTSVNELDVWDLSLDILAKDEVDIVKGVAHHASWDSRDEGWPDLILVGHRFALYGYYIDLVLVVRCQHILLQITFCQHYV